ncbi:MAG TPA: DUF4863 family protein [Planctomycetota bacterium]|nr:DUF4863 family protein [Planctomycetota bacterium]
MTRPVTKEQFVDLLRPLATALRAVDVDGPDGAARAEAVAPFDGAVVASVRQAALASIESPWLLPKAQAGIRFGRVVKDLEGFSVDAVLMDVPGPRHRHPNGEIDLCMATKGEPTFDGHPAGWVVYGTGSVHVPTVRAGEMLILYFLPGGAIEFGV